MVTPVARVGAQPAFGGAGGPVVSQSPVSIAQGLPPAAGALNAPTTPIVAPEINTSRNRQTRASNITIPYSRIVPLENIRVGRTGPG